MDEKLTLPKIINDPVHGFIEIPRGILLDLIDTEAFQRLRRIKQLGLSSLVYPGAIHTRFNHALGALHLMRMALDVLRRKSIEISEEEYEATLIAILMHDVGHGPFSHALEKAIIPGLHHEDMSLALLSKFNQTFEGRLGMAIQIFQGKYHKTFLHQLVSSQLDMDRMDYLIRDSFFTGVAEGIVGIERIIKILNVVNNQLVCEYKGIYSIEKFIIARRLMYWQVYLHKTAMVGEFMMLNILKRARWLYEQGKAPVLSENLAYFLKHHVDAHGLTEEVIGRYIRMDDTDIESAIKLWQHSEDKVLADLCRRVMIRRLLKISIQDQPFSDAELAEARKRGCELSGHDEEGIQYFVFRGEVINQAYLNNSAEPILILYKSGELQDLSNASDMQYIKELGRPVTKYYLCYLRA